MLLQLKNTPNKETIIQQHRRLAKLAIRHIEKEPAEEKQYDSIAATLLIEVLKDVEASGLSAKRWLEEIDRTAKEALQ